MPMNDQTQALEDTLRKAAVLAYKLDVSEEHAREFFRKCFLQYATLQNEKRSLSAKPPRHAFQRGG